MNRITIGLTACLVAAVTAGQDLPAAVLRARAPPQRLDPRDRLTPLAPVPPGHGNGRRVRDPAAIAIG